MPTWYVRLLLWWCGYTWVWIKDSAALERRDKQGLSGLGPLQALRLGDDSIVYTDSKPQRWVYAPYVHKHRIATESFESVTGPYTPVKRLYIQKQILANIKTGAFLR